jgi:hypothetical protein
MLVICDLRTRHPSRAHNLTLCPNWRKLYPTTNLRQPRLQQRNKVSTHRPRHHIYPSRIHHIARGWPDQRNCSCSAAQTGAGLPVLSKLDRSPSSVRNVGNRTSHLLSTPTSAYYSVSASRGSSPPTTTVEHPPTLFPPPPRSQTTFACSTPFDVISIHHRANKHDRR